MQRKVLNVESGGKGKDRTLCTILTLKTEFHMQKNEVESLFNIIKILTQDALKI